MIFDVNLKDVDNDMNKLRNLFNKFQEMTDEEIEPLNVKFYDFLEQASQLASSEYGFSYDEVYSYYKLKSWLQMCNGE